MAKMKSFVNSDISTKILFTYGKSGAILLKYERLRNNLILNSG